MADTLLQGGIEYNEMPAYKRNFLRTIFNPRDLSNQDYTTDELNALRQAVYNKEFERNNREGLNLLDRIATVNKNAPYENKNKRNLIEKVLGLGIRQTIDPNKYFDRNISYENYAPTLVPNDQGEIEQHHFYEIGPFNAQKLRNANNGEFPANFSMEGAIGRAPYTIDDKGNVSLSDTYDFGRHSMGTLSGSLAHLLGEVIGHPYKTNLNLGNINDWKNMEYTGNDLLGIRRY